MVFSTLLFLFRFLPITLALYYLAPAKWKNTVLFVCSLVFYSWGEVRLFPIMALAILINYTAGLGMEKFAHSKRARLFFLIYSIVGSIGMLMFFKYTNFFITNINALLGTSIATLSLTLPLGISFYTFQTMSYSIDVYRGDVPTEHNLIDFGAYVVMFPQLIAGPIVKYRDVSDRLHVLKGRVTMDRVEEGVYLFILGLAKKVLLADGISALWYDVTGHMVNGVMEYGVGLENASTPLVWLGLLAYTLQIYFDFSGYSLMGIGMGKMLGFDFPDNFNLPYISKSITEFWRRWHMTLSSWFREYVYIPLGGNRKCTARKYINLLATFAVSGLWHGTGLTFLIWGLLHGLYQVAGAVLEPVRAKAYALLPIRRDGKLASVWQCLFTFLLVHTAWVFFRAASVQDALYVLTAQFAGGSPGEVLAQVWGIILAGFNAKPLLAAAFAAFLAFSFAVCCALDAVRRFSRRSVQGEATPVLLGLSGWRWLCYYAFAGLIFLGFLFNNGYLTGAVSFLYANF